MTEQMKVKVIKQIKGDNGASFISENAHLMTKDDLVTIVNELFYGIYDNTTIDKNFEILKKIADELDERL